MRLITVSTLAFGLLIGLSAAPQPANAGNTSCPQHRHRNIEQRQSYQQRRIDQGVASGNLTGREAARLERQRYKIERQEQRYRKDGNGMQPWERKRINKELNAENNHIYNQKHDEQHR